MGFSGSFLLVSGRITDSRYIEPDLDFVRTFHVQGQLWSGARVNDGGELFRSRREAMPGLFPKTGVTLLGESLDSNFLALIAYGGRHEAWSACINCESVNALRREAIEDGYDEGFPRFMEPDEAARRCVAWANGAGLTPDLHRLKVILGQTAWVKPLDLVWDDVLDAVLIAAIEG